jgi:phospholipid transport system substrate-binding protein
VNLLRKNVLKALVVAASLTLASAALAGEAMDVVRTKQTTLFELLQAQSAQNDKKVGAIFDEMLDYAALSEASLGSEWAPRTDAEKAEFSGLLKPLVQKAYERNLRKTLGFNVEYLSEEEGPTGSKLVGTRATKKDAGPGDEPVSIVFQVRPKDGRWRVEDISTRRRLAPRPDAALRAGEGGAMLGGCAGAPRRAVSTFRAPRGAGRGGASAHERGDSAGAGRRATVGERATWRPLPGPSACSS